MTLLLKIVNARGPYHSRLPRARSASVIPVVKYHKFSPCWWSHEAVVKPNHEGTHSKVCRKHFASFLLRFHAVQMCGVARKGSTQ
jgi:hypothetical protein